MGTAVFGLVGAGGFAREVMPLVRAQLVTSNDVPPSSVFFVETDPRAAVVNGMPCISEADFFALPAAARHYNIAIGDSLVRQRIDEEWTALGALPLTIRAADATVLDEVSLGDTAILCGNTIITSNATIGRGFHSNLFSYVAHDCVIGDYVTFAPGVHCNGSVHIGDHAYLGTGAILRQGTPDKPLVIGAGATVGMGAVVTKDVAPGETVVGNPARPLVRAT